MYQIIIRFFAGIYNCKELDDMKPEHIILYYSQSYNRLFHPCGIFRRKFLNKQLLIVLQLIWKFDYKYT